MTKVVKYVPKTSVVGNKSSSNQEFNGGQRFSDINRCEVHEGFIILKAHRSSDQFGDKHGKNIRDKLFTPREALEWASTADEISARLMMLGDPGGSCELHEIAADITRKAKEALQWREQHNVGPDEKSEILRWKKSVY